MYDDISKLHINMFHGHKEWNMLVQGIGLEQLWMVVGVSDFDYINVHFCLEETSNPPTLTLRSDG